MKSKDNITLENTPEFIQLRDINDKIFKENFSIELDKLLESFYNAKFKGVIEKVDGIEYEVVVIKDNIENTEKSLVCLKEIMSGEHIGIKEKLDEINLEIQSLNKKGLNELRDILENEILEINKINNLKLIHLVEKNEETNLKIENNEKQVKNTISKINDIDKKVAELITKALIELKSENNTKTKELIDLAEVNHGFLDEDINSLSTEIKKINKKSNENLALTEEKYELINQRIDDVESKIKSNFDLIQQEDGLIQLTNYRKENDLQISSLKSAIMWLMGINIVLAISILAVLIIVLL